MKKMLLTALPIAMLGCVHSNHDDTLQGQLDIRKAQWENKASAEDERIYNEGIEAIRDTGVIESAKNVGDRAPGFTLPDAVGKEVSLDSLLKDGPVIVVFYRGAWCPYCNLTLAAWQDQLDQIHALGGELVAISPQLPDYSLTSQEKNDLTFPVLSDVGNQVAGRFGIVSQVTPEVLALWEGKIDLKAHNGEGSGKLPLAATYLIDTDRTIRFAFLDAEYRNRAEPSAVIDELRALQLERGRLDKDSPDPGERVRQRY